MAPADRGSLRRPDLFIIGAPKSGTTSLYEYLDEHPDVYMSPVKEPGYFSPDVQVRLAARAHYAFPDDQARYLELFAAAGAVAHRGEASTTYLMSTQAPQLIQSFEPNARIIAMLRNPVDLVHSLHNERVSNGIEPLASFEDALAADEDRRRGLRLPEGLHGYGVAYRDNACLGQQLALWLEHFGRDQIHVTLFDEFAADPKGELHKVLEFLGVDANFQPASFAARNVSHRRRRGIVQRLISNSVTRSVSRRLIPALIGEPRWASARRRLGLSRLVKTEQSREPMRPETRQRLRAEFADDVALLGRLIERDLAQLWFGA